VVSAVVIRRAPQLAALVAATWLVQQTAVLAAAAHTEAAAADSVGGANLLIHYANGWGVDHQVSGKMDDALLKISQQLEAFKTTFPAS
jgi:hypothetical protein